MIKKIRKLSLIQFAGMLRVQRIDVRWWGGGGACHSKQKMTPHITKSEIMWSVSICVNAQLTKKNNPPDLENRVEWRTPSISILPWIFYLFIFFIYFEKLIKLNYFPKLRYKKSTTRTYIIILYYSIIIESSPIKNQSSFKL